MTPPRGNRRRMRGVVVRDKADKTITVQVNWQFRHPIYGKMVRKSTRVAAHDETNAAHAGDTVEIAECRPMSKTKRWRLLKVLAANPEQAVTSADTPHAEETPAS